MACLLKLPTKNSKGVISFTNVERDRLITRDQRLKDKIESLKNDWAIGLHHNWYDFGYKHNPIFDFVIASNSAIVSNDESSFPLLNVTASNFVPDYFGKENEQELFWDILHVSRAQKHKNLIFFFEVIRELYDQGRFPRVLLICTIPDNAKHNPTLLHNIRDYYDELFSEEEKDRFTLLTTDYRNPFPFDLEMIAHFYKSSKVLFNTGNREYGGRVNSYAWRSSMPVVAMENIKTMLPEEFKCEPFFFEGSSKEEFVIQLQKALSFVDSDKHMNALKRISKHYKVSHSEQKILDGVGVFCMKKGTIDFDRNDFNFNNLSLRFARHHEVESGSNGVIGSLMSFLEHIESQEPIELKKLLMETDPEVYISKQYYDQDRELSKLKRQTRYKNQLISVKRRFLGLIRS